MTKLQIRSIKNLMEKIQNEDNNGSHLESYKDIRREEWTLEQFKNYYSEMLKEWYEESLDQKYLNWKLEIEKI